MHRLLIAAADHGTLHSLIDDLADKPVQIDTVTDIHLVVSHAGVRRADIVLIVCDTAPNAIAQTLGDLQRTNPYAVRLLLGGVAELRAVADAIGTTSVFRLVQYPWRRPALKSALDDACRFRTLQQVAATAINRVRDMERTSTICALEAQRADSQTDRGLTVRRGFPGAQYLDSGKLPH